MATNDLPILVAVRPITYHGERQLGNKWTHLVHSLRALLQKKSVEESESSEGLMLFSFNHPYSAYSSVFQSLETVKREQGWKDSQGTVPVQIVFHLSSKSDPGTAVRELSSNLWNFLQQEKPYVTRALKVQWDQFMAGKDLPEHSFENEGEGVFRLVFTSTAALIKSEELFPCRDLPLRGKTEECFYCGMNSHAPAVCPSKFLTMDMRGLADVGYVPFPLLVESFKKVFANQKSVVNLLAAGVDPAKIRKNVALLVYVAYFDIFKVFQPRFLWNLTFSSFAKWGAAEKSESLKINNRHMQFGLDYLRVGKYAQAEEAFSAERLNREGKPFYAAIGQAFVALEKGRVHDMGGFLDRAQSLASLEKERIYNGLLLTRYYNLIGDYWKAKETVTFTLKNKLDCSEVLYYQIQLEAATDFNESMFKQLQMLVLEQKNFFMAAMMDPRLLPVHGFVEEMLSAKVHTVTQKAKENMARAKIECDELLHWFDEDHEKMQLNVTTLANLEKQFQRKSYYDLLNVAAKAKALIHAARQLREESLDVLKEKIDAHRILYEKYQKFWNAYSYKPFFKKFQTTLAEVPKIVNLMRKLIKESSGKEYRDAVVLEEKLEKNLEGLKQTLGRMLWIKTAMEAVKRFGKYLIYSELVLAGVGIGLIFLLSMALPDSSGAGLFKFISDPWFQKQAMFIITLLIAPLVALSLTVWSLKDSD